jgi:hypothetical protein
MKTSQERAVGKPTIDLIEEGFALLRTCPPGILTWYFMGNIPFAAGLLVFFSEMSGNPAAAELLPAASAGLAGLFFWMAWAQARFSAALLAHLRGSPAEHWGFRRNLSLAARQAVLQATGLVAVPLSSLTIAVFGPVCTFYQAAAALDDGHRSTRELFRAALSQALLWPGQSIGVFSLLSAFSLVIIINWMTLIATGPVLLEMFTGIESVFTRSPWSMINSTFFSAVLVLTFLTIEPLTRACTVLRCFYGLSITTGDDIRARLRRGGFRVATAVVAGWLFLSSPGARAAEPAPPASPEQLEQSIRQVIEQDKYRWRRGRDAGKPREAAKKKPDSKFRAWWKNLREKIERAWRRFFDWMNPKRNSESGLLGFAASANQILIYTLLAVTAAILAFSAFRAVRARRKVSTPLTAAQAAATPDLNRDDTAADALPEDEWTRLGRRLLEEGNLRLALRAFYLASLAHLAGRGLVTIARGKSNREYARELERRSRTLPDVSNLFGENVGTFERIWYGLHEVNADLVGRFVSNVEQMKAAA